MAAQQDWFSYGISNPHASDDGVDLGTPDNTPVDLPLAGQVIDASYHVYGGQVVVKPDGGAPWDEYAIHLNRIYVHDGDEVAAGEIIGTTGGGVGDLILKGGRVQPATSQADYQGHSSGYHSEFGLFEDTSAHGDMGQFNQGWGNPSRQMDPTGIIAAYKASGQSPLALAATPISSAWPPAGDHLMNGLPFKPDGTFDKAAWVQHVMSGGLNWNNIIANTTGIDVQGTVTRVAFGGLGLGLILLGAMVVVIK